MLYGPKKEIILKLKKVSNKRYKFWKEKFNNEELLHIQKIVKHLNVFIYNNFSEIRACYINNISIQPICPVCGQICQYDKGSKTKYTFFCSSECFYSDRGKEITSNKRQKTNIKKYGVKCPGQLEKIKEKTKKTNIKKYGVECPLQSDKIKEKTKKTNIKKYDVEFYQQTDEYKKNYKEKSLKKYGVEHPQKSDDVQEKKRKTCHEKYGVENVSQVEKYKEKRKDTFLKKYGVEHPQKSNDVREKTKKTNLEKYGVENILQVEEFNEKRKATCLEKYGMTVYSKTNEFKEKYQEICLEKYQEKSYPETTDFKEKVKKTQRKKFWDSFLIILKQKEIIPMFDKAKYISYEYSEGIKKYKCLKCKKEFESETLNSQRIFCPHHKYKSQTEYDIKMWLECKIKKIDIHLNKRFYLNKKCFECDVFLPEYNIGIEYHGLYWHSDFYKEKKYHKDKYLFFKELGIELIQVFESEWTNKQDIVKSIILNKLSLSKDKYFARKLNIQLIDNEKYKEFCLLNHIQGYGLAKVRLGLYTKENELVQVMSFSKPRYNKKYDWENIRTASKLNTIVVGGFSKLLKYFKNNYPGSIISYVDVRFFNGSGYIKNGFKQISHTNPNYFYFKSNVPVLEARVKYQKHKLKGLLEKFNENLTEYENMVNNKYLRIFDAGNLVFVYE